MKPSPILLAAFLAASAFATRSALAGAISVPDGGGGFFVAWDERRNESEVVSTSEVLVQRFTALGAPAPGWPAYGLHVTDSPPNQDSPSMVSDGAGGVIVVWLDHASGGLMPRAQHLSPAGQHLWSSVGMALSEGDSLRGTPFAVSDGAGGAFVTWSNDPRLYPGEPGVVLQHLASDGAIESGWPVAGLLIKQDAAIQGSAELFDDGAGGAIVVWPEASGSWFAQRVTAAGVRLWSPPTGMDFGVMGSWTFAGDGAGGLLAAMIDLSAIPYEYKVIAQRFDGSGAPAWGPTGVVVRSSPTGLGNASVAADGSGGAIVGWAASGGSFAQRLDAAGTVAPGWPVDGAQFTDASGPGVMAADGSGGAFFAWSKGSGNPPFEIMTQHLLSDGTRPAGWPLSGALVASGVIPSYPVGPMAISDGSGGAIVSWGDARSGLLGRDLRAQRLDVTGVRQWGNDGFVISSGAQCQRAPAIVGDGAGGAVAFWMDKRSGGWDIYGKRVDAAGLPLGVSAAISAAANDQVNVQAVGDGAGGGCVAWQDLRNGVPGVEAQRLTPGGAPAWAPDGVDLVEGFGNVVPFGIASDGAGGAIVTWPQAGVFAQRLDAGGTPLWGTGGVSLVAFASSTSDNWIDAITDGAGGAIMVWTGFGFDPDSAKNVYGYHAQRLNAAGSRLWGNDGVVLARDFSGVIRQRVTGDGAGGVYIAWQEDELLDGTGVIRVQHRDASGHLAAGWPEHGIVIASLAVRKRLAAISPDGAGGVVVGWGDLRSGSRWASYVQRVATDATVKWLAEGVLLTTNAGDQLLSGIVPDGSGGAIALWMDGAGTTWDLRAQHVNDAGVTQWSAAGLGVCTAAGNQYAPAIVSDGAGGAVVAWQDDREFPIDQIFMARIGAGGTLLWPSDGVVPVLASVVSAEVRDGVAHVEWQMAAATHAQIERSDDDGAWSNRATLDADGQGRIRFDDADVRPAHRYGWRLAIRGAGGVTRVGQTWLDIPVRESFALHGTYPNPSSRDLSTAFSLPAAAPARLEVLDVSGRRVWSREVGTLGAGRHVVSLPALRSGVYMVRLTQGSRSETTRFERVK